MIYPVADRDQVSFSIEMLEKEIGFYFEMIATLAFKREEYIKAGKEAEASIISHIVFLYGQRLDEAKDMRELVKTKLSALH